MEGQRPEITVTGRRKAGVGRGGGEQSLVGSSERPGVKVIVLEILGAFRVEGAVTAIGHRHKASTDLYS